MSKLCEFVNLYPKEYVTKRCFCCSFILCTRSVRCV